MKNKFLTIATVVLLAACQSSSNDTAKTATPAGVHTAVVQEVLQSTQYTYLHVKEGDKDPWLAVPKMEAKAGDTYYYKDGLVMNDFNSKDLNRTFKEILFLDNVSTTPNIPEKAAVTANATNGIPSTTPETETALPPASDPNEIHTIKSVEVLQTTQYTYIRAKEGDNDVWVAVTKMDATAGKTYYFKGGLKMTNFASKELKRTFAEVLFVDNISAKPITADAKATATKKEADAAAPTKGNTSDTEKKDVKMKHAKDDITIAKLIENKKTYAGKTIKIKGQVTKFTGGIMKKNWIHLQDGTDFSGKFDLAVTTNEEVKVGDNITVEGVITLDKDFGFGYFYEVIMEDAKINK